LGFVGEGVRGRVREAVLEGVRGREERAGDGRDAGRRRSGGPGKGGGVEGWEALRAGGERLRGLVALV
jgi:hypothetical protein